MEGKMEGAFFVAISAVLIDCYGNFLGSTIDGSVTDGALTNGIPIKGLLRKKELKDLLRLVGAGFLPWLKDGSSGLKSWVRNAETLDCLKEL